LIISEEKMMKRLSRKIPRGGRRNKRTVEQFALLLRNNMTRAEEVFWKVLKKKQRAWKHKFEPQMVVGNYILDFGCESLKLGIEIDGRIHDRKDVKRNDRIRTRRLNKQGWTIIRFRNADVFGRLSHILNIIEEVSIE
jgi:very-short-patch-repair endonuclease